jgi:flagellar FliJ protein
MPPTVFKFRFAPLLRYRKRILDRLSLELAELHRRLLEREAEMNDLERRHSSCTADLATRVTGTIDPEQVLMYHNYLNLLSSRMQTVREEMARLNGEVQHKTNAVIAASKNKKIVERIRERDLIEFNTLLADTERKILDEVGTYRAATARSVEDGGGAMRIGVQ